MFKKNKTTKKAYQGLLESVRKVQMGFLMFEHGFTKEQLKDKTGKELCDECAYKQRCAEGNLPECLFPIRRGKEIADDNE